MIRVMVVEDEGPILRSICERIQKAHPAFEIMATAYNGREAIDILREREPDVLFVDMNLPVLNGIEVLKFVRDQRPDVIPVVLSGYKDFEYVKSAFENKVIDYLLKPLREEELQALLLRIEASYDRKQRQRNTQTLAEAVRGSNVQVSHEDEGYHMVIITAGHYHNAPVMEGNIYHEILGKERLERIFREELNDGMFWSVDGGSVMDRVAFVRNADLLQVNRMNAVLRALQDSPLPVTLTVNRSVISVNDIYDTYRRMRGFIEHNMLFGCSSLLIYHGEAGNGEAENASEQEQLAVARCRQQPEPENIYEELKGVLENLCRRPVRHMQLVRSVRRFWAELCVGDGGNHTYIELEDDINFILYHNYDLEGLLQEFRFVIDKGFGKQQEDIRDKKVLASRIKEYLDQNYGRDITNQSVSERFGLVPSYLSSIFKEYHQVSMGDYLIRKRIEMAKRLLDETDMKIREIAEQVGYRDPLYFSRAFKKGTGVSPKKYKINSSDAQLL